jgi:hypothetical protein
MPEVIEGIAIYENGNLLTFITGNNEQNMQSTLKTVRTLRMFKKNEYTYKVTKIQEMN